MNVDANESLLPNEVILAIENGNKIEAIKLLREKTGLGLRESKEMVEAYEDKHPGRSSPLRKTNNSHGGLMLIVILVGLVAYVIYRFIG